MRLVVEAGPGPTRARPGEASLERLNSAALVQIDQAMFLLVPRTGKKTDVLLPMVLSYVAEMMKPLVSKIDAVHYTQRSRVLKVAEEYAIRLLQPRFSKDHAELIARRLVNSYAEHEFVIDRDEAEDIFGKLPQPPPTAGTIIDELEAFLTFSQVIAIGRVVVKGDGADETVA
jgi:hypothetical protein